MNIDHNRLSNFVNKYFSGNYKLNDVELRKLSNVDAYFEFKKDFRKDDSLEHIKFLFKNLFSKNCRFNNDQCQKYISYVCDVFLGEFTREKFDIFCQKYYQKVCPIHTTSRNKQMYCSFVNTCNADDDLNDYAIEICTYDIFTFEFKKGNVNMKTSNMDSLEILWIYYNKYMSVNELSNCLLKKKPKVK